jgi:hypothetical protein
MDGIIIFCSSTKVRGRRQNWQRECGRQRPEEYTSESRAMSEEENVWNDFRLVTAKSELLQAAVTPGLLYVARDRGVYVYLTLELS